MTMENDSNGTSDVNASSRPTSPTYTTNAHDLEEAAKLQARLSQQRNDDQDQIAAPESTHGTDYDDGLPSVSIDEGANKYVLVSAHAPPSPPSSSSSRFHPSRYRTAQNQLGQPSPSRQRTFVYSRRGASYHRNVAEFLASRLESRGYRDIRILGGGRILRDDEERIVRIFGYSYGFWRADHGEAKRVVEESGRFAGYDVRWSNEGY